MLFQYMLKGQNDTSSNVTRLVINSLSRIRVMIVFTRLNT